MRKGTLFVEMLVIIAIIPFVWVALDGLFIPIISGIPRSYRIVQANTSMLNMLKQIHKDIDTAEGLPESFGQYTTNNELLLIESADGIICYRLKDDEIIRDGLTDTHQSEDTIVWSVPHGKIEWQVRRKDNAGYAVEVKTYIEHTVQGRRQKKMANSHLYFVGAFK